MNLSKRTILLMTVDFVSFACCGLAAMFMMRTSREYVFGIWALLTLFTSAMNVVGMALFGAYKIIWRYATIKDFVNCFAGILFGTVVAVIFATVNNMFEYIFMVPFFFMAISAVVASRTVYKYFVTKNTQLVYSGSNRTLIVGGGDTCRRLIQEMGDTKCDYNPIIIADDDPSKLFRTVMDIKIAGTTEMIPQLVNEYDITHIIVAMPSVSKERQRAIAEICAKTKCKVKVLPYIYELITATSLLSQAREINTADLLGRDEIEFDVNKNRELIEGKVCMVTGGGGSIGSELSRQIAKYNPAQLVIVDIYENNAYDIQQELKGLYADRLDLQVRIASVRDLEKMEKLFCEFKPQIVFHAAAHKHVPLMEDSPEEAIKNNVFGTYNIARLSEKYNVKKFVLVSTDKAVNPTNVMGATKRCCEMIVEYMAQRKSKTEFAAVRFGNVLGSNGSVIPLFRKQIENGGPVTVTHPDIIRYFMTIPEAVSLILQAASFAKGGEIFVLDMGEPVKITTLAENLIRLMGREPYTDIKIEFTGLRPGEKLFEELLMSEEGLKKTENNKIFIGKQIKIDENEFLEKLEKLKTAAEENNSEEAVKCLRKAVPTFVSPTPPPAFFGLIRRLYKPAGLVRVGRVP